MQDFRNLDSWQKAHALALRVYAQTNPMPQEEVFGIRLTLRRSAVAIATHIVEGCGRENGAAFAADLQRAIVKCNELEYLLLLAHDLHLLGTDGTVGLSESTIEVRKMVYGLVKKL